MGLHWDTAEAIRQQTDEARLFIGEWQMRLSLPQWQVEVEIVRGTDHSTIYGRIFVKPYLLRAKMQLVLGSDHTFPLEEHWLEQTVIHELLHIWTNPWNTKTDTMEDDQHEAMLNRLAAAYVTLKYTAA